MKKQSRNVTLSIVSHGQQDLVKNLLASLDEYLIVGPHNVFIVVVENTHKKISLESRRFGIRIMRNSKVKGFGENHNSTFSHYPGEYFFVINPDVKLCEAFNLPQVIEKMDEDGLDIASPIILSPTLQVEDYKRADVNLLNLIRRRIFGNSSEKFEWFAGIFLVVRSESFRALGGFDEKFFMYVEDCDFCMRARSSGMRLGDLSECFVVHDARRRSVKNARHFFWHINSLFRYWFF